MIRVNIHDAKTHLSRYLARLRHGEVILLCRRNVPIAEIRRVRPPSTRRRPLGRARGDFVVEAAFFQPLPDEVTAAFEGRGA